MASELVFYGAPEPIRTADTRFRREAKADLARVKYRYLRRVLRYLA